MKFIKLVNVVVGVFFVCICSQTKGQTLTSKDFKLLLDGKEVKDSAITVRELLEIKQVTTNFSWLTFKDLIIYLSGKYRIETDIVVCPGNTICDEAKREFKKLKEGSIVIFQAGTATNKSGHSLTVSDLPLKIR